MDLKKSCIFGFVLLIILLNNHCSQSRSKYPPPIKNPDSLRPANTLYNKIISFDDKNFLSYKKMINSLNKAQVIFIGETHNNKIAHEYQLKIFKALYEKDNKIALSMEMFERDVQKYIDQYLDGKITEKEFLSQSRPWRNYKSDYRPLVEFAKSHKLKIIAMNTPRRILRKVLRNDIKILSSLSLKEKSYIAENIDFNDEEYRKYFYSVLPKNHPGVKKKKRYLKMMKRFLLASAIKDSTMAESIVRFLKKPEYKHHKVISINGTFHSDYGTAIPKRIKSRDNELNIKLITIIPLAKKNKVRLSKFFNRKKIADFIIFTKDKVSFKRH